LAAGIADAGTVMTLHRAAPATKLMARAFMGDLIVAVHLAWINATGVHVGCRRDRSVVRA
jgi:hypothetical protein